MERPELRSYQKQAIERVFKSFESNNSVMLQMPTGTGKTVVFTELVKRWLGTKGIGKRVLFVVHRSELVDQITGHLSSLGIVSHRIQGKIDKENLINFRVHVGTVQTLQNADKLPENLSLIVIDEAHHTPAMSYRKIIDSYVKIKDLKVLGVTATPQRLSGENFADLFNDLILSEPIKRFQELGFLSPTRHFVTSLPNLSELQLKMNDYDEVAAEKLMLREDIMADLVDSYQQYAQGKKAIVFAVSVKHSMEIAKRFLAIGIKSAHIDGKTPSEIRKNIVEKFKLGEIQVLSNVNVFTEGFDCPDVEVVQLARPTKSLVMYLQMVGRVMRPFEGKQYGLILDNARLWQDHGLSNQKFYWNWNGNELNPERRKLEAVNSEGEGSQKLKVNELKGLELVEVSDESNIEYFDNLLRISEKSDNLPNFNTISLIDWIDLWLEKKMLPFNTLIRDDIHFKVVERINEETVISNFVSSKRSKRTLSWSKEFNEIDQNSLFDVKNILKYIAKSLLQVYYLDRYGERVVKSWESDFIIKFENLELTIKRVQLEFSFNKEFCERIKEYREFVDKSNFQQSDFIANVDFLNKIHPQFSQYLEAIQYILCRRKMLRPIKLY
jgi:superfamily II DNA or RNA helicase